VQSYQEYKPFENKEDSFICLTW